jgi:plasmid stability protein
VDIFGGFHAVRRPDSIDRIAIIAITMANITIRNLDDRTKDRLRLRAAYHKRSMEEEARIILRAALEEEPRSARNLADAIAARVRPLGGVELAIPPREPIREPPKPRR